MHRKLTRDYLRTGKAMDDAIGKLLAFLDSHSGVAENTLVAYTSDQGYFLGEHGLFDKRFMWEESLRTPTVLRFPREIAPGTVLSRDSGLIVSNADWAPTLLDYALDGKRQSADPPKKGGRGRSFRRFLATPATAVAATKQHRTGSPAAHREALYYRYYGDNGKPAARPGHFGIRTARFKLILYYSLRCVPELWPEWGASESMDGPWELFDLDADPLEKANRYQDLLRRNASTVRALQRQLAASMAAEGGDDNAFQPARQKPRHSFPTLCLDLRFDSKEFASCLRRTRCDA